MATAAALIIGDEILSGKIREENVFELSQTLRARGVVLARVLVVPDDVDTIGRDVRELSESFDHVFTSGGVGPTHDDVTMASIARAFGVLVTREPVLERLIRDYYGDDVSDELLMLADVPEGSEMITAGGSAWPATRFRNVWILPGVPQAFRMKLPIIREALAGDVPFVSRSVFLKIDEAKLKQLLDEMVAAHPDVSIGSYPRWHDPRYETKVTFDAQDPDAVARALEAFQAKLPDGEPQWTE